MALSFDDPTPQSRLGVARSMLAPKETREPAWPALAAAALFAVSALGFAYAAITAPVNEFKPVVEGETLPITPSGERGG